MTRGNQREMAREKAAKKAGKKDQSQTEANKGLTLEQRKKRDADALQAKQAKKAAQAEAKKGGK